MMPGEAPTTAAGTPEQHGNIPLDAPLMLRPEDVARRWGVNVKTVYAAIRRRQLPVKRLGQRVLLIPRRAVEDIEQGRVALPGEKHGSATR
jgi:excisionase family DNA binding protein